MLHLRVNPPLTRPYPEQVPSQAVDRWTTAGKQKAAVDRPLRAREHQVQSDTPSAFGTRRLGSRLARSAGLFQMRWPRKQYGRDRDETAPPRMTPGKARVTEGNRPERRSVGSGSLESRRRRPARWGFGGALGIALGCRCRDGSMVVGRLWHLPLLPLSVTRHCRRVEQFFPSDIAPAR